MSDTMTRPLAASWTPPRSFGQLAAEGRALRDRVPRRALADLRADGRDPMGILDDQDTRRVSELVPIRTERMASSAFAFFRGTAALMADDLSRSPTTDLAVGSCGDAHVANFGLYASPQRTLVFDLNDFDESAWAPWEWDLKRLVASVVIAGHATSRDEAVVTAAALDAVRTYARAIAEAARRGPLERYYERYDADAAHAEGTAVRKAFTKAIREAERRTGARAAHKLTFRGDDGRRTFAEDPPTMTHVDVEIEAQVVSLHRDYLRSANVDIRALMQQYAVADIVRRVVGVGSVGTRCYLIALQDGEGDALLLQAKQAETSVLIAQGGAEQPAPVSRFIDEHGDGGRVVAMQRILQAVSDPFLGYLHREEGEGLPERSFYIRQFNDMKAGFDAETLEDDAFGWYANACAAALARAHAQSPEAGAVAGYVGGGRAVGEAILEWSQAYAVLSRADWQLFLRHRGVGA